MCTIRISLCLAALFAAGSLTTASAQQSRQNRSGQNRNVNQRERAARDSWQPTRSRSASESSESVGRPINPVRQVDHSVPIDGVPSLPSGSVSVIDPPIHPAPIQAAPLDGQIVAPHYEGACDSQPPGICGCGDTACDGGCDSLGCDGACGGENCSCCGELCSPDAWRPCVTLCLPTDGWVSFEYLSWWQDGMRLPPLVTTNVSNDIPQDEAGVLTSPTTRILFGGNEVLNDQFNGGRLRFGVWLDRCHTWGIGAEFFQIGSETDSFSGTSTGDPILARPFFNTQTGREDSELVAYPGVISGTVKARAESELGGAGVHLRYLRCCDEGCTQGVFCGCPGHFCSRTEALIGLRYLKLDESLTVTEDLISPDGSFDISDRFQTRNEFVGLDIGWSYRRTRDCWTMDCLVRLGVGNTRQTVRINGETTINSPQNDPTTQTLPGGLLTQTSNIGKYSDDQFAVVPEFNANLGYQMSDHVRLMLGYTFIYWSNVVRTGDQIDLDVNTDLLPPPVEPVTGPQRPAFRFDTTDYWVQGINLGLEYRW